MRLLFDLSSLIRWRGPTVGMTRAQQELARYAREHRADVVFTVFDPHRNVPRAIRPEWLDQVIENKASIEPTLAFNPGVERHGTLRRMPKPVGEAYFWATHFRRKFLSEIERTILAAPPARPWQERVLRRYVKKHELSLYFNDDGSLRPCPPLGMVLDDTLKIAPGDVYIGTQSDWIHTDLDAIVARQRQGLRRVILCYDIIPILFPQWYQSDLVAIFSRYYARAFATADRVIFNARSNLRDATHYCRSLGFDLADARIVPLGCDFAAAPPGGSDRLPAGLEPGRYAVFVSTIEPRKNHRLLADVWSRLTAEGLPMESFKLVFVGRRGWMMEEFFEALASGGELGRSILHLESVSDNDLRVLYAKAAFSLYPSIYEGFGLPPIESMLVGTPVIASNGGALPEVVKDGGLSLDPGDFDAWYGAIRRMIEDTAWREAWAARARAARPTTWQESGEAFFAAAAEPFERRLPSA